MKPDAASVDWDPYAFGGSARQVRQTQERFVRGFAGHAPVLDIGCGRGIFLQLLREARIEGIGIDVYEPSVAACLSQGLNAHVADALDYLPGKSVAYDGIFCSHVIEHLAFGDALRLIRLCASATTAGGVLIVVTPNPRDFSVIGETFWLDPTHVRPYPVPLLSSMLEKSGFDVVDRGTFHGGLPKREWGRALFYRLLLGRFHGHPNAFVIGRKR